MKNIIKIISVLILASGFMGMNAYAAGSKTGATKATASISASCRIKVDNMAFGDVSMQAMSGNGDIYATTQLSLLCTKDQATTLTSNYGVNATTTSTSWVNGENFICVRSNTQTGVYTDVQSNVCLTEYNAGRQALSSTPFKYSFNNLWYKSIRPDGSSITAGESPTLGKANLVSGTNKISYVISTNNSTYAAIGATAGNPLTYNQNNGDWQNYPLYGKANVAAAVPGIYTDTNTITINF